MIFIRSALCLCVFAATFGAAMAADLAETRDEYRKRAAAAMIAGDSGALVSDFAEDIWIQPEYQETAVGPEKARAYFDAYLGRFDVTDYVKAPSEVFEIADITVEIGSFTISQIHRESGKEHDWAGTYFDVWQNVDSGPVLLTQAWNYDAAYEDLRTLAHFSDIGGIPAPNLPGVPVSDPLGYEIAALKTYGEVLMTSQQPGLLHLIYAEDSMYAPHDTPMVWGRDAIETFMAGYTEHWPPFTYVDVETHRLHAGDIGVLEHSSYSLRWVGGDRTGTSMGKGLRIWKRSEDGQLQHFRQIAMHDF